MNEMRRNVKKRPAVKKVFALLLALSMFCALLAGCGKKEETDNVTVRVGAMSGPTAMGMVKLMKDAEDGTAKGTYEFADLSTDPSTFVAPLTKGDIDIAAVPSNLASVIYNNTNGGVQILAVNTLGVLNIVERGDSIQSIKDLAGKKVYATGQGATPEYTLRHILKEMALIRTAVLQSSGAQIQRKHCLILQMILKRSLCYHSHLRQPQWDRLTACALQST